MTTQRSWLKAFVRHSTKRQSQGADAGALFLTAKNVPLSAIRIRRGEGRDLIEARTSETINVSIRQSVGDAQTDGYREFRCGCNSYKEIFMRAKLATLVLVAGALMAPAAGY